MRFVLAIVVAFVLAFTPTATAQDSFLEDFHFERLSFVVHPSLDGKGTAIMTKVAQLRVEGDSAFMLRKCIDADPDYCSYASFSNGDDNGTVTAEEVLDFENLSKVGLASQVPEVNELSDLLKRNVHVDHQEASSVVISRVDIRGAEGSSDSTQLILLDIEAKVQYSNDPKARQLRIDVLSLLLKPQGFVYSYALWELPNGTDWKYKPDATQPDPAKARVGPEGYFATQDEFENTTAQGLTLVLEAPPAKKKSPAPSMLAVLVPLALIAFAMRRKP